MKKFALAAIAVVAFGLAAPAFATPITMAFSGTGPGVSFHGIFDLSGAGTNFTVTNVTGTQTYAGVTSAITGLSYYAGADEILAGVPLLPDFSGISFTTASNGDFNLYDWNGGIYELSSNVDPVGYPQNGVLLDSFTVGNVPEPVTVSLFGAGLVGAIVVRRRRKQIA